MNSISMSCPNCGTKTHAKSIKQVSLIESELMFQCPLIYCSSSWISTLKIARTITRGKQPNPEFEAFGIPRSRQGKKSADLEKEVEKATK
ncbi:ogr/Delta-like zinc finger family protein [Achromobacter sp. SD115]|nr:ogr/Delta-like zinc finger family protein [Achromobacter sp. SD115]